MKYLGLVVLLFIALLSYNFADYFNVQKDLRNNVQILDISKSKTDLVMTGNWVANRGAYKQDDFAINAMKLICDAEKLSCRRENTAIKITGMMMEPGDTQVSEYALVKNTDRQIVLKAQDGNLTKIKMVPSRNPFSKYLITDDKTGAILMGRQQIRWMVAKRAMQHGTLGWVMEMLGMHRELEQQQ